MVDKINEIIESVNAGLDPEEVLAIVRTELENYYTKEEVDDLLSQIDLSLYYTKTEVDTIISRVDGDVDALEGRMDTAEDDIDTLETGKQDVLTVGDGIDITSDVISLDNEWEAFTTPTHISQLDTTKYDYLFDSGNAYALLVGSSDRPICFGKANPGTRNTCFGDVFIEFGNSGGSFYPCKFEYTKPSAIQVPVKVYLMDGTLLDANNKDTYFDSSKKPIADMRVTGKYSNFVLDLFLQANSTKTQGMMFYNGTIRFASVSASILYTCIGNTDICNVSGDQLTLPNGSTQYTITTCYRRLK